MSHKGNLHVEIILGFEVRSLAYVEPRPAATATDKRTHRQTSVISTP